MPLPSFRDLHAAYTASGFGCTNEQIELLRELIQDREGFERGGGICSAGEVPLLVLLPKCKEVVVVDHSYRSLAAAWAKILLLDTHGPKGFLNLIQKPWREFLQACEKAFLKAPSGIQNSKQHNKSISWTPNDFSGGVPIASNELEDIRRSFQFSSEMELRDICNKLNRLTILHGDLSELPQMDLLYISNAFQHIGRAGLAPTPLTLAKLLNPGGVILRTDTALGKTQDISAKLKKTLKPLKWTGKESVTVGGCNWCYLLEQPEGVSA